MSLKNTIIILITAFFFAACAPKQFLPARHVYVDPGDILFAQAEELFQAKLYEKALIKYTEYLSRFPKGCLADAALMKTGAARVEILVMLYNEGKYNEAIKQANDIIGSKVAGINIVRT
ncbi:MAG: hypothetical protein KAU60_10975, partial [Desulfobacterales bacterium]|nr:hypothetical protein [Desulfobacterales bacterium]